MNALKLLKQPQASPRDQAFTTNHETIIEPARGWSALKLREVWDYRDLLYFMVMRDLKTRYSQTALGPLWIIINPLFSMVLYTVIFGVIAKLPSGNVPYQVFTYCALLPWDMFSDDVGSGSTSLLSNRELISKIYFPRLVLPFSRVISSLVDFWISFVILIGMLIFYRITPTWGVILIPFFLLLIMLTGLGIGLWFSGIIVKYRDFGQVTGYLVRALMYLSPVVYSSEVVPERFYFLYHLNPMANVLEGFRWALLGTAPPDWIMLLVSAGISVALFLTGLYQFRRVERSIVDIA